MIEIRIREMAEKRGFTTAYQLQKALGVTPSLAARLWKHAFTRIDLNTLNKLCRLLDCQPHSLFHFEPDDHA